VTIGEVVLQLSVVGIAVYHVDRGWGAQVQAFLLGLVIWGVFFVLAERKFVQAQTR
jgi:hypothetical protein